MAWGPWTDDWEFWISSSISCTSKLVTPRSFLYAVGYFASAFGYNMRGGSWNRAKRLALSFAMSKTSATNRAPGFQKATLVALERCVMDGFLPKTERIACGKLRLCIQCSTRYDDILQTPLAACERLRKPWRSLACLLVRCEERLALGYGSLP